MKKENAFTLIELLAVIVVLAIIALIANPIVMNTIKNAKKGAAERSADTYIEAVETVVATEHLDGNILEGEYEITSDGNLCRDKSSSCSDENKIYVEMSGSKPSSGKIAISNGKAEISSKITIGAFDVVYNSTSKKYEATEKESTSGDDNNSTFICHLQEGTSKTIGAKYTCHLDSDRTFYVLEATGDNVSLIMDRNFTDEDDIVSETLAWCTDDGINNTTCENINSKEQMPLTYIQNIFGIFDIDISFPTFDQVYKAAGNKTSELPMWLYDYLDGTPNSISGVYGYWTSSPDNDYTSSAISVSHVGVIHTDSVSDSSVNGVRPVITLSKSQLN